MWLKRTLQGVQYDGIFSIYRYMDLSGTHFLLVININKNRPVELLVYIKHIYCTTVHMYVFKHILILCLTVLHFFSNQIEHLILHIFYRFQIISL